MSLTEQLSGGKIVEDVVKIALRLYPDADEHEIRKIIWLHWSYGTLDVIYRGDEIVACVRWNISPTGRICDVLDWYVSENEKGFRIMKNLIARNWGRYPGLQYIRFYRQFKYPGREPRIYSIKRILRVKEK